MTKQLTWTLVSILALAAPVHAQDQEKEEAGTSPPPAAEEEVEKKDAASEKNEAEARELFDKGKELYEAKSYSEAVAKLEASLQLDRAPDTILLIAHCYRNLGFNLRALKHYRLYLEEWKQQNPDKPSAPLEVVALDYISELEEKIRKQKAAEKAAKKETAQRKQWAAEDKKRREQMLAEKLASETKRRTRRRRILRILTISSVAAAGAATFLGGAFFDAADSARHDQSFDSARRLSTTGFVAGAVFGAAAITCGVWYFLSRPAEKPAPRAPSTTAGISPTPGGAAASAAFRF